MTHGPVFSSLAVVSVRVCQVWPKTLLPMGPREAEMLDTSEPGHLKSLLEKRRKETKRRHYHGARAPGARLMGVQTSVWQRGLQTRPPAQAGLLLFVFYAVLAWPHTSSFIYCLGPPPPCNRRLKYLPTQTVWPSKNKIFTIWPFTEKVC